MALPLPKSRIELELTLLVFTPSELRKGRSILYIPASFRAILYQLPDAKTELTL
jgi:hypothetical protein